MSRVAVRGHAGYHRRNGPAVPLVGVAEGGRELLLLPTHVPRVDPREVGDQGEEEEGLPSGPHHPKPEEKASNVEGITQVGVGTEKGEESALAEVRGGPGAEGETGGPDHAPRDKG
jgi:hypothetical protein